MTLLHTGETEQESLRRFTHRWLIPCITLALPGMGPTGLLIGTHYDPIGGDIPGFRGLGKSIQMLPTPIPQEVDGAGTPVDYYWAGGDFGQQVSAGFVMHGSSFVTLKFPETSYTKARGINQAGVVVGTAFYLGHDQDPASRHELDRAVTLFDPPFVEPSGCSATAIAPNRP